MPERSTPIWTVSAIAEATSRHRHQVEYVIDTRNIEPVGVAGAARIFSAADVEVIREEFDRIDARRREVAHA